MSQFANTAGCIYEEDGYTKLIRMAIEWISQDHSLNGEERKAKKPVLIIEDLDRLDPKHLFRILNVVSAHIEIVTDLILLVINLDLITLSW